MFNYNKVMNKLNSILPRTFTFSLNNIYSLAIVYSFGLFGAAGRHTIITNLVVIIVSILSLFVVQLKIKNIDVELKIGTKEVLLFVLLLLILIRDLIIPFSDDAFAHTYLALQPSVEFFKIISKKIYIDQSVQVFKPLWVINFLAIFVLYYFFYFFKNKKIFLFISLSFFLLILRYLNIELGGGSSQHPPFRLFALWITSTLGFFTDFSFRFQGVVPLFFISLLVYKKTKSILSTLTIISFPLLLHSSAIIEFSIWNLLCGLILIYRLDKREEEDLYIDSMIITIFCLIRQPSIALVFFIVYKLYTHNNIKLLFKSLFPSLIVIMPSLVFILSSILDGNPAINHSESIPVERLDKIISILLTFFKNFGLLFTIFTIYGLLHGKHFFLKVVILITNLYLFSSTHTYYAPRYQIEIFGIFLIIGFIGLSKIYKPGILYAILLMYNIFTFENKWKNISDNNYQNPIISEKLYPYKDVLEYLLANDKISNLYILGYDYKGISLILNNASILQFLIYSDKVNLKIKDIYHINNNPDIKLLAIEDRKLIQEDLHQSWLLEKVFTSIKSNEKIFLYRKI